MGLYWNPWAVVGTIASVLGCALAAVVYATRPDKLQNRTLALYLATNAGGLGIGVGLMFAANDVPTSLGLQAVALTCYFASGAYYLLFLSTLPTRTTAWLRPTPVRALLWALPFVTTPATLIWFDAIVAGVIEVPYAKFDSYWTPLGVRIFEAQALFTGTWGIVAAIGALLESPRGSVLREQAKWYASTFVVYETIQIVAFVVLEIAFRSATPRFELYTLAAAILLPAALVLLVLMLAYSMLRTQLFDIDLRVKRTVSRSTVAAAFVAVFFAASEAASAFFGETTGSTYLGIAAAALLLFALAPLQRVAERVGHAAMPHVVDNAEYRLVKKREVYRAAVESAMLDDEVTQRERMLLATLADELGLTGREAAAVEADVARLRAAPS